jgi:hypothetical protein
MFAYSSLFNIPVTEEMYQAIDANIYVIARRVRGTPVSM